MNLLRRRFLHLAAGAASVPAVSRVACAQAYPTRPVRIIVGFAPAGPGDIVARLIGQWLSERLGQQFVIDNDVVATRMSLSMPRARDADITFERIAVTPEQITAWALPTRPTKPSDTRSKNFGEISVELDAIEPNQLRALVQETIERHLPPEQFEKLKAAEESERDIITRLVGKFARKRLR